MSTRRIINFYSVGDDYGEFSNFSPHPITLDGKRWPTSEHYFQAQKFQDESKREEIRNANRPMLGAKLGRDRKSKLRPDWESVKVPIMRDAVRAKFTQHQKLRALLLSTGDAKLVEHTKNDSYWGDGGEPKGPRVSPSVTTHQPQPSVFSPLPSPVTTSRSHAGLS